MTEELSPRVTWSRGHDRALTTLRLGWPLLLVVVVFVTVGDIGFSPTDEGLVQAAAQRILRGEIPHVDIVSPRPLGSGYLHVVDLALPTPLVATSRFLALCEIAAYTVLLAALAYRAGPRRWGLAQSLLVATAILVNTHTFPVTAWHTIDGLLLTSAGFVLLAKGLARRRQAWVDLAMLVLGAALVVKQSFAPAFVLGLVWIITDARGSAMAVSATARRVLRGALVAAVPAGVYTVIVASAGGIGEAVLQLTSGGEQTWSSLTDQLERAVDDADPVFFVAVLALVGLALADVATKHTASRTPIAAAGLFTRVVVTVGVADLVIRGDLELYGAWGTQLLVLLFGVIAWRALSERRLDGVALLTAAVALMSMLSWGYAVPDLLGGSIALVVIERLWRTAPATSADRVALVAATTASALALVVVAAVFVDARHDDVYRHPPDGALDVDLGTIAGDLEGIRSNDNVARYLRQVRDCIEEHPASRVAILPDNAMLSPVFDLENPFPSDWMFADELADSKPVIIDAARRLGEAGDYLVLFETVPAYLIAYEPVPAHVPVDREPFFYGDPLGAEIRQHLRGEQISCGSFVGVYAPGGSGDPGT